MFQEGREEEDFEQSHSYVQRTTKEQTAINRREKEPLIGKKEPERFTEISTATDSSILKKGPQEQSESLATKESNLNENLEQDIEALLEEKREELELLQEELQNLRKGYYPISEDNLRRLVDLSNAFHASQNTIRATYRLRDYINFCSHQGIPFPNDYYIFLDKIAQINEENSSRAYVDLMNFQQQVENSQEVKNYLHFIKDSFIKSKDEINALQKKMSEVRSITTPNNLRDDDTTTISSISSLPSAFKEKIEAHPSTLKKIEKKKILKEVKEFIDADQWYTRRNGKNIPTKDPITEEISSLPSAKAAEPHDLEHSSKISFQQVKNPSKVEAIFQENETDEDSENDEPKIDYVESLSLISTTFEPIKLEESSSKTSKRKKEKTKKFKAPPSSPSSEELLEQRIRKEHRRVKLADANYHSFQEHCARLAEKIVTNLDSAEYAYYAPIIPQLSTAFIEGIKQFQKYNYFFTDSDSMLIKQFKKMLHHDVNKEYNERLIQQKIASEKLFLKKREEAAAAALAELEAEEAQQKLLTKQKQDKKKTKTKKK